MNNGINFGTRSDIIAAIPSLLGYIPTESFVVILLDRTDGQTTVRCAIRGDIDTKLESVATLPTTAAAAFHGADSAILLTISGPWHDTTATTVLNTLRDALESKNIRVRARMIARDTNQPDQWWDIDTNTSGPEAGSADTNPTTIGRAIAADRDAITREFTPTLNLAPISKQPIATFLVDTFEEIATAAADGYAPSLSLATRAAIIITSSIELRDTMILVSIDHPENAAQLWTSLANQLPGEARLHALTIAAALYYLCSDTIRAGIALEIADNEAHAAYLPYPRLAHLLTLALHAGYSPADLREHLHAWIASRDTD